VPNGQFTVPIFNTPYAINTDDNTTYKFTQEVRLASPSNNKFEWMVGAYYTHEEGKIDQQITSRDAATGQPFTDPFLVNLGLARLDSKYKEIAGFTNVTWHATDQFDITAGARVAKNKQSAHQVTSGPLAGVSDDTTKSDESVFTYSVSPRFEINDSTAIYARIAKGYRPGGPNVLPPTAPSTVPRQFNSDTLTSYEVGLKADLGHRSSLDIAAYHLNWKDIQLFSLVDNFGVNVNGGTAASNGIEGSLTLHPVTGLTLGVNGAWTDAHLTEDTPLVAGGRDGDKLPYVPKLSFSLNTDYDWHLSDSTTAFLGATFAYTGNQRDNFNFFGVPPQRRVSDYAMVDFRGGVEFDRFTVEAYVKNVTNTRGVTALNTVDDAVTGANNVPFGGIYAALTRPRTFGLSLSAGF